MKYFVFSDCHGDYNALMAAIEIYGYEPTDENHTLISCGDNFGRSETGKGSKGIYEYLTSSIHKNKPICLMGNHELILKDILFRRSISLNDIFNGENKTVSSFLDKKDNDEITAYEINELSRSPLMDWLLDRPFYFETTHYIFLHGFFPFDTETLTFITSDFESVKEEMWVSSTWSQTPQMIMKFAQDHPNGLDKTIVFGHWHASQLRREFDLVYDREKANSIWKNEQLHLVGLDCCTFVSRKIEMLVIED